MVEMIRCIKCGTESEHAICEHCADVLVEGMNQEDLVAHALVGMDAIKGKGKLLERLKRYKSQLRAIKQKEIWDEYIREHQRPS